MNRNFVFTSVTLIALGAGASHAGPVNIPHQFTPNTPAVAAEVNANFGAVETAVDDNANRIATLEATIASLQGQLAAIQSNSVLELDGILTLENPASTPQPTARFSGVNVQIVNGTNDLDALNGVGNLIVGYNGASGTVAFCSLGSHDNQGDCENAGHTWAADQRSGSHNLILGNRNAYTSYSGVIAGSDNIINRRFATVTGGSFNIASGEWASVSGGESNSALGDQSSVSGGHGNVASGEGASISGGHSNAASGGHASVTGGLGNDAIDLYSAVHGDTFNTARGAWSAILGGTHNSTDGSRSTVGGGNSRNAPGEDDWVAGSLFEDD